MYVRLAFAVAAHLEPEILLVDEVLAVGDVQFQKKCLGKMESVGKEGRTIMFISHNMSAVKQLCSRCIFIENGKISADSDTSSVIELYLNKNKAIYDNAGKAEKYFEECKEKDFQVLSVRLLDESGN
jgi:lipopolysaccharide transport system ATP-binding protein